MITNTIPAIHTPYVIDRSSQWCLDYLWWFSRGPVFPHPHGNLHWLHRGRNLVDCCFLGLCSLTRELKDSRNMSTILWVQKYTIYIYNNELCDLHLIDNSTWISIWIWVLYSVEFACFLFTNRTKEGQCLFGGAVVYYLPHRQHHQTIKQAVYGVAGLMDGKDDGPALNS